MVDQCSLINTLHYTIITHYTLYTQHYTQVTLEGGLRCHRMGMWRKYALFLYIAALLSADNENYGVAHALVSICCVM